jgi:hypothetical protein
MTRSERVWIVCVLATVMLAASAASASAIVVHLANGRRISAQPLRGGLAPSL